MREIKFRFWLENKEEAFMCQPSYFLAGINTDGNPWFDKLNTNTHKYTEDQYEITPLQYTGLKDKNGKEVYEGDVAEIQQPTSTTRGRVEFREASFCFVSERYPNGESVIVHLHSIKYQNNWKLEVIGNIYENKDLLNK